MEEYLSIGQKQQLARRAKPFTNEKWCFVQDGVGQQIEEVFVNHKSSEGDEGVAWGNNRKAFCTWDHIEEDFRCKVVMAHNVQRCQWFL
jgi:hypothetical protein